MQEAKDQYINWLSKEIKPGGKILKRNKLNAEKVYISIYQCGTNLDAVSL